MTKCKECGTAISTKADACPKCGAKQVRTSGCAKVALGFILIASFLVAIAQCSQPSTNPVSHEKVSASSTAQVAQQHSSAQPAPPAIEPGSQWSYDNDQDKMGKGTAYFASIMSENTVDFKFPYSGSQHATLLLRLHPRFGKSVILSVDRGQFLCHSYDGCVVLVRFDDQEAQRYSANGPSDNSTTSIFIRDYSRFFKNMTKAKRMRIAAEFFQQGSPVFEFDVSNFNESKLKLNK